MRRYLLAGVLLAFTAVVAWYVRSSLEKVEVTQAPLPPLPVERPDRLQLKRIPDDPAIEAQLPEPCPLTAVEYRYGNLMTNVLVERFDGASTSRNVVLGRRRIQVNTDGAPNSYHSRAIKADDEAVGAINIICNADVKIFKKSGDAKIPVACRKDISVADEYAAAYEELRNKNWEETESGYSIQFNWDIIGRGVQSRPDGPYGPCINPDGFFVAKTRLRLRSSTDECDGSIYPDSSVTSAFVLPMNWFAGYRKRADASPERFSNFRAGDVVAAYRPGGSNRPPVWAYGVIGDSGPFAKLGEATIAFNRQLRRSEAAVRTYRQALALDTDTITPKEIGFVVFEGSASSLNRDYSPANIAKAGEQRLAAWMGGALDKAQARFLACAKKLELLPPPQPLPPA
jgi:hypothetical protein